MLSAGGVAAAAEANATWAAMDELLDASGARIAALCGCEAARVVPGASAGIALAVGACIARGDGRGDARRCRWSTRVVLMQRGHEYKYARCAALAGARVEWVDDIAARWRLGPRRRSCTPRTWTTSALAVDELAPLARAAGVPVVVDAAYLSFPLAELARWSSAGTRVLLGQVLLRAERAAGSWRGGARRSRDVAALDFAGYESGPWRTFGRAFKLDRSTVVGHGRRAGGVDGASITRRAGAATRRWRGRWRRAATRSRARVCAAAVHARRALVDDGPVNAVVVRRRRRPGRTRSPRATRACARWPMGDALVFCTEALRAGEVDEIGAAVSAVWPN